MQEEQLAGQTDLEETIAAVEAESAFDEGATSAAVIELPTGLSDEAAEELRRQWLAEHGKEPLDAAAIDQLTDEEAAQLGSSLEVNVPMLEIPLHGAGLRVVTGPEGQKAVLVGPVAVTFALPLDADGAKNMVRALTGGIEIATKMPTGGLEAGT